MPLSRLCCRGMEFARYRPVRTRLVVPLNNRSHSLSLGTLTLQGSSSRQNFSNCVVSCSVSSVAIWQRLIPILPLIGQVRQPPSTQPSCVFCHSKPFVARCCPIHNSCQNRLAPVSMSTRRHLSKCGSAIGRLEGTEMPSRRSGMLGIFIVI